jgi:hypothetical protein
LNCDAKIEGLFKLTIVLLKKSRVTAAKISIELNEFSLPA